MVYPHGAGGAQACAPKITKSDEKDRNVTLTEIGEAAREELLGVPLRDPDARRMLPQSRRACWAIWNRRLRAQFLFKRNKDYLVQAGKVIIVDEFTGRLMPGGAGRMDCTRRWKPKKGSRCRAKSVTYATITIQNYFRMYEKLAGMTGTALTEAEEFDKIYKLECRGDPHQPGIPGHASGIEPDHRGSPG